MEYKEIPPPPWRAQAPPWKRWSGSAAQPAKNHRCDSHRSASDAHPVTNRGDSTAELPAHRVSQSAEGGAVEKKLLTSVAYLKLPEYPASLFTEDTVRRAALGVIQQAKEAGADVINIVFDRADDIDFIEKELQAVIQATTQHPGFSYRRVAQLLTLFSPDCGSLEREDVTGFEGDVPVICLTLSGPHETCGNMIIVNAAAPRLLQPSRERRTKSTRKVFHHWVPSDRGLICYWVRWGKGQGLSFGPPLNKKPGLSPCARPQPVRLFAMIKLDPNLAASQGHGVASTNSTNKNSQNANFRSVSN